MKVLSAQQLRDADVYTITHEPVSAIGLMERAAQQCINWLLRRSIVGKPVFIFCGKGGSGGDGLAIARLLADNGVESTVFILEFGKLGTPEFQTNLACLHALPVPLHYIQSENQFPEIPQGALIIDALYGFGLNRPLDGLSAALVRHLNNSGAEIISIDLPSGLYADASSANNPVIHATHTLTFECYKPALLVAENAPFIGDVHILHIHLFPGFLENLKTDFELSDVAAIKQIFKSRNRFSHKGSFGHALVVGGSYGKMGAVVLAASACLRCGVGLVSTYIPNCGYNILQSTMPEAMTITDPGEKILTQAYMDLERFSAIGIGPGMGTEKETAHMLYEVLKKIKKPAVLDADALNLLAHDPSLISQLFENTILTPHPKEFERLFGATNNDFERINLARKKAALLKIIIVLKGHHTLIALPDGRAFFNTTGNSGMAKGGSGDVLTGMITALLAQGYPPTDAAILGVYLHGSSGDFAAHALSMEAMTARDIITFLSQAFLKFSA